MTPEEKQLKDVEFEAKKTSEKKKQDKEKKDKGKYKQALEKNGYSVTEYVGPHGDGWELISKVTIANDEYIKVEGEGAEANNRNHDWVLIKKEDYGN